MQVTCLRRSPGPAAATAKTPKIGPEIRRDCALSSRSGPITYRKASPRSPFALGSNQGSAAPSPSAGRTAAGARPAVLTSATGSARITVTGTGNVTGTPNQLVLAMGVQVNGSSVGSALARANDAVNSVTAALRAGGVAAADIQTSGLSIWPNYPANSQTPSGYGVSESLTATLNSVAAAGAQIDAAVHPSGDATTVSGISLNLTDTSALLAQARARAVADATAKAAQYARRSASRGTLPDGPV
jgi:uncharacterized protein